MKLLPLWIVLGVLGFLLLFVATPMMIPGIVIFRKHMVRKNKDEWSRKCSDVNNSEQMEMFARGEAWGVENSEYKKDLQIENDGFKLAAEYFDFGYDKAVIIVPGRTEGCLYSQYFAKPYKIAGYNVLTIDNRAHGLSEGKYNSVGLKEYRDVRKWGELLHEQYDIKEIVLHGICIGSATALYSCVLDDTPDYIKGIVTDGMYTTFAESFKNHIIEQKRPLFPVQNEVMALIKIVCGVDAVHNGPIYCIDKLNIPILFLYTKLDLYSTPDDAKMLYEKCKAPKRIVWFDKGCHSHIRINAEEKYDQAVSDFLADMNTMTAE